jgi:uncharacterized protein (UPF0548 family)
MPRISDDSMIIAAIAAVKTQATTMNPPPLGATSAHRDRVANATSTTAPTTPVYSNVTASPTMMRRRSSIEVEIRCESAFADTNPLSHTPGIATGLARLGGSCKSADVAIRIRRPNDEALSELLAACRHDALTYSPIGGSLSGVAPPGLPLHEWSILIPSSSFGAAANALRDWSIHRAAGLTVVSDGPLQEGTNVAMSAPIAFAFVDVTCRVIAVVDEPERFGFAYGTLSVHPERGEESFIVERHDDRTEFVVRAVSGHAHWAARVATPVARRLQDAAVRRYLDAMRTIAS